MAVTHALLDLQSIDVAIDRLITRRDALDAGGELAAARAVADEAERALGELGLAIDSSTATRRSWSTRSTPSPRRRRPSGPA